MALPPVAILCLVDKDDKSPLDQVIHDGCARLLPGGPLLILVEWSSFYQGGETLLFYGSETQGFGSMHQKSMIRILCFRSDLVEYETRPILAGQRRTWMGRIHKNAKHIQPSSWHIRWQNVFPVPRPTPLPPGWSRPLEVKKDEDPGESFQGSDPVPVCLEDDDVAAASPRSPGSGFKEDRSSMLDGA